MRPYGSILKRESIAFSLARVADDICGGISSGVLIRVLIRKVAQLSLQPKLSAQVSDETLIL